MSYQKPPTKAITSFSRASEDSPLEFRRGKKESDMAYALRRYCRRYLRIQSLSRWVYLGMIFVITVMLILSYNMILNNPGMLNSDYTHPVSVRWRNERLSLVIRPELETARIQPRLENNSICKNVNRLVDKEPLQVLIMVMSAPPNMEAREAIRYSWGNKSLLPSEIEIFFILGTTNDEKVMEMVEEESEEYNDIIMEDFVDSYDNLTYKTLFTLKWASKWCSTATHLLKTDDDMLIIPHNLIERIIYIRKNYFLLQTISMNKRQYKVSSKGHEYIKNENDLTKQIQTEDEKTVDNLIMKENDSCLIDPNRKEYKNKEEKIGSISGAYILGMVYRHIQPYRNSNSKWFLPFSLYYEDYLPDFAAGISYVISDGNKSCGTIKSLLINSLKVKPVLPLEDVFITGIVAEHLGLPLIEDNRRFLKGIPAVFPWSLSRLATCYYYNFIAIHGLKPKDLLIGWAQLHDLKAEECNTISGYIQKSIYKLLSVFELHIDKS